MLIEQLLSFSGHHMYPIMAQNNLMKSIEALKNTISQRFPRSSVIAATALPKDASTEIVQVNQLSTQKNTPAVQNIEVAFVDGRLRHAGGAENSTSWLKMVALAEDCQSCNVLLVLAEKGVVLKTIRRIAPGEELLMWFTENILAMMNMPFLTPANIQGQNRYVCHQCHVLFEYPNPLKVHLALHCDRFERSYLWTMLAKEFDKVSAPNLSLNIMPPSMTLFQFTLTGSPQTSPRQNSPNLADTVDSASPSHSPNSSTRISPVAENLSLRHSAFKPYLQPTLQNNNAVPIYAPEVRTCAPRMVQPSYQVPQTQIAPELHAAQMETIVSNLGKSKQGHLCIYCGKVYSRKYGLKIHIRTHTGYKPLKCKYCLRPFGDPSNLNKHVRLHAEGDTPYKCELCGKVLVRRRDLERHIKSRHQEAAEQLELSDASSDSMDVE
ncbi:PR domain zinc finger protein 13 [Athalia rosae]|uniref:PR domain zinc finger protein 13 n=1 Tax=Athalia rosae TaxID=37344 RepID=UPI002034742D|nr:PR domain zinc finger protein 13 [Athalia rosae]